MTDPASHLSLTADQTRRYSRQLFLDEVGRRGQERLLASCVAIEGDGLAAEEAATYLGAAGVGRLALDAALGERLRSRLAGLNPDVTLVAVAGVQPDAHLVLPPGDTDDRLHGAQAALSTLVALTGAGESR